MKLGRYLLQSSVQITKSIEECFRYSRRRCLDTSARQTLRVSSLRRCRMKETRTFTKELKRPRFKFQRYLRFRIIQVERRSEISSIRAKFGRTRHVNARQNAETLGIRGEFNYVQYHGTACSETFGCRGKFKHIDITTPSPETLVESSMAVPKGRYSDLLPSLRISRRVWARNVG